MAMVVGRELSPQQPSCDQSFCSEYKTKLYYSVKETVKDTINTRVYSQRSNSSPPAAYIGTAKTTHLSNVKLEPDTEHDLISDLSPFAGAGDNEDLAVAVELVDILEPFEEVRILNSLLLKIRCFFHS